MDGMRLIEPPDDRWDPVAARQLSGRDEVRSRSYLIGTDPALTKEGGGNYSAKGTVLDHRGEETRVLWISSWGCDAATATAEDFPALRLDDLLRLRDSGPLSETEMIDYLRDCGLLGEQRRPGIETLTHAFIPAAHVDHCHPDAVIALTSIPDGQKLADEEFGDEAIWFDYRQFDVDVARELASRIAVNPRCRFVLLANHGIFTWADSSEECYRNSLEAVARATNALGRAIRRPPDLGGPAVAPLPAENATDLLFEILPVIRGALSAGTTSGTVLHVDRSAAAVEFVSSVRGPRLTRTGPGCPDHLVTVGYRPLVLGDIRADDTLTRTVLDGIERHRRWYNDYYERNVTAAGRALGRRGDAPRAMVLPGIGVVTAGSDAAKARLCADHFGQTMTVIRAADAAGGYVSLTEQQGAADEYWPLMRLKPQLRPADGRLAGRIFLVAGANDDDVITVADRLAADNAHVALAGEDPVRIAAAAAEIADRHGERRGVALGSKAGESHRVVRDAVLAYGGFDVVIDMTDSGDLAHVAQPVFGRQGTGGAVLLANTSWTPGELAAAVARKAGQATHGVTVNGVAAGGTAVAAAVLFFTHPASDHWTGAVLDPRRARDKDKK